MSNIKLFESKKVRSHWNEDEEKWYFSVVDVCEILSGSNNPRRYWSDLKIKMAEEGANELYEKIVQLKMEAPDGKMRLTDCADTEGLLRIIQSIPSPKAEPFKLWLAKVGYERMQEIADPAQSLDRARENWQKLGRSQKWIQQRMTGQETRNKLTDYWKDNGVEKPDGFTMHKNKTPTPKITCERIAALKKLAKMPDESIDYSDIPPITDFTGWTKLHAKKKDVHTTLDEDVLKWVKAQSKYVSRFINQILR